MKIKEIYKIVEGANVWNLTSSDTEEVFGGDTYIPTTMGRSEYESKNELSKANIEISFSIDNVIARRWIDTIADSNVTVTVWTKQDDTYFVTWKGRLSSVKPVDQSIKLIFESVFTSLRRPGLRRRFQRNCGHVHYGRGCFLNKEDFAVGAVATVVAGINITCPVAAGYPNGHFTGGIIKAPDGSMRFIMSHAGSALTVIRPFNTLVNGNAITIYPGCNRTRERCNTTFANLNNNGSFPFIPIRNPFTGNSFA
jgi:uncharacterized phage protein (TIGR02218 family)